MTMQDFTSSLRTVLTTQKILAGIGVGSETTTALHATMQFLFRDGCSMIGWWSACRAACRKTNVVLLA